MTTTFRSLAAAGTLLALTGAALAHHGWSWAEADQIELSGRLTDVCIGAPHPVLKLATDDGEWTVELGNPNQTRRSGFTAESAAVGDTLVALGNRSTDASEKRMKAVRVTVRERTYDIYPECIRQN